MENTKTCRFCHEQIANDNFRRLDFAKIQNLKSLINLDTTVNDQTLICSKCADVCQESYSFKNACLRNDDYLKTFNRPNDDSKLILEDVIVKTIKSEVKCEEERVCRFCLNYFEVNSLVEIYAEETITLKNMLGRCLPEIDMSIVQNPLICYVCRGLLEKLFNFISRCDDAEVLRNLNTKTDIIVNEDTSTVSIENEVNINNSVVKKESIFGDMENPEIEIKTEDFDIDEDVKDSVNDRCKIWSYEEEELESSKCNICSSSANNKHNIVRYTNRGYKDITQLKYACDLCPHRTNQKSNLKSHYRVHQDLTENDMFKCNKCPYVTKWKSNLVSHYKARHEDNSNVYSCLLVSHKITHRDPSEAKMYECAECSHLVCDFCSYQTLKIKNPMLKDNLIDEEPLEMNDYCPFVTKSKTYLTEHAIRHKDPSELPKFKCNDCPYETNKRSNIVRHVLVHKHPSKVVMFKCKVCPYQTKYKHRVSLHERRHRVEIYTCDECNYKTKFKGNFTGHVRYHKEWKWKGNQNLNEARQHKCDKCSYVGMRPTHLRRHQLLHKDPSERVMYSCEGCSYQALHKLSMSRHYKKNHADLEMPFGDLKTYRCNECEYETSYRRSILKHLQTHAQGKRTNKVKEELQR